MKYLKLFKLFEAKLPDSHIRKNIIKDMPIGASGYTVPWALRVDMDGECYLNGDFSFYGLSEKCGTICLKIKRVKEGYIAYINDLDDDNRDYDREVLGDGDFVEVVGFDDNIESKEESLDDLKLQLKSAIDNEDYRKASVIKNKINNHRENT